MEITPGLHRIDTPLGARLCSVYVIVGERETLVFDTGITGTIDAYVLPYLATFGVSARSVRWVVISHCDVDHFGGVADAHAAFPEAEVVVHEADADAVSDYAVYESERARGFRDRFGWDETAEVLAWAREVTREGRVDVRLDAERRIDLGGREIDLLHVPGHTRGHLAVHDPSTGTLIIGDAALGTAVPNADGTPAFPPTYRYVGDYRASISRIQSLAPNWLLTTHYQTMTAGAAQSFLHDSTQFVDRLDQAIRDRLTIQPASLGELATQLSPQAGAWPVEGSAGAMVFPVAGHLEELLSTGEICAAGDEDAAGAPRFTVVR